MPTMQRTELDLVATARELVAAGRPWREVAAELESKAGGSREALAEATLHWVSGLRRRRSDDFQAAAVLRALEAALARAPWGADA